MGLENNDDQKVNGNSASEFRLEQVLYDLKNAKFRHAFTDTIRLEAGSNEALKQKALEQKVPSGFVNALKEMEACLSELRVLYNKKEKEESKTSFMNYVEWTATKIIAHKMKMMINPQKSYEPRLSGHVGTSTFDDQTYIDFLEKLQSIQTSAEYRGHGRNLLSRLLKALSVIASITCSGTELKNKSERQKNKSTMLYELGNRVSLFRQATIDFDKQPSQLSNSLNLK